MLVTYVSPLYTGSISDKEITRKSGLLNLLEPGDEVMVDKGFTIDDFLSSVGASLVIPPFKRGAQLSKSDCDKTQAIARLRILVERVIRQVKVRLRNTTSGIVLCHSVCLEASTRSKSN